MSWSQASNDELVSTARVVADRIAEVGESKLLGLGVAMQQDADGLTGAQDGAVTADVAEQARRKSGLERRAVAFSTDRRWDSGHRAYYLRFESERSFHDGTPEAELLALASARVYPEGLGVLSRSFRGQLGFQERWDKAHETPEVKAVAALVDAPRFAARIADATAGLTAFVNKDAEPTAGAPEAPTESAARRALLDSLDAASILVPKLSPTHADHILDPIATLWQKLVARAKAAKPKTAPAEQPMS